MTDIDDTIDDVREAAVDFLNAGERSAGHVALGIVATAGFDPLVDQGEAYAEALIAVHGEPDLADPVHARVGGEFTTAAFDSEHFDD